MTRSSRVVKRKNQRRSDRQRSEVVVGTVAQIVIGMFVGAEALAGPSEWVTFLAGAGATSSHSSPEPSSTRGVGGEVEGSGSRWGRGILLAVYRMHDARNRTDDLIETETRSVREQPQPRERVEHILPYNGVRPWQFMHTPVDPNAMSFGKCAAGATMAVGAGEVGEVSDHRERIRVTRSSGRAPLRRQVHGLSKALLGKHLLQAAKHRRDNLGG